MKSTYQLENGKPKITREEVYKEYIEKKLPLGVVAYYFKITIEELKQKLQEYNIQLKPHTHYSNNPARKLPDDKTIKGLYVDKHLSSIEIAKMFGLTSNSPVCRKLGKMGITRPRSGPNSRHGSLKGGEQRFSGRYKLVFLPEHPRGATHSGFVFEHIIVAEKKYGRLITDEEMIHHIDLDKTNNNPDNLIVSTVKIHRKYHNTFNKIAQEIAQKYFKKGTIAFSEEKGYYLKEQIKA